jgi:UDP-glucuronate decarboxylase
MKNASLLKTDIEEIEYFIGPDNIELLFGKTILLCGAGGFIGRYFVELIKYLNSSKPHLPIKLIAVDNFITKSTATHLLNHSEHISFHEMDIIKGINFDCPIDYIIHAAGIASPFYYAKYPIETMEVATIGTKNLLELAVSKKVKSFLFFSSSEIYGDPDPNKVPTDEAYRGNVSCLGPRACYDESKRLGETLVKIYQTHYGVPTKIVRPFNVYGPGMNQNDYRVVPDFISRTLSGKPIKIYKPGTQTRTFCYATDAINGFVRVLLNGVPGEPYNIGNELPEITIQDLADQLEFVAGYKIDKLFVEHPDVYPGDEPIRRCPDITKANIHVGYKANVSLQEGLKRSLTWAAENYELSELK